MRNILCFLLALGLVVAELLFGSGCCASHRGLPDSARFEYDVALELIPAFERAATRIEKASGIVLVNDPGGARIELLDYSPEGSCADTVVTGWPAEGVVSGVYIDLYRDIPGCYADVSDTLLHELIHSLRRVEDLDAPNLSHSEHGVFTAKAEQPVLEETSLNAICEVVDCKVYNPEE